MCVCVCVCVCVCDYVSVCPCACVDERDSVRTRLVCSLFTCFGFMPDIRYLHVSVYGHQCRGSFSLRVVFS